MISRRTLLRLSSLPLCALAGCQMKGSLNRTTRWGMAVDITECRKLTDCNQCITACHEEHNVPRLPDGHHDVRWIWRGSLEDAPVKDEYSTAGDLPVLLMCNHCDDPPCTRVCPTQAAFKREDGIVMTDWHRCIGCRYCMAACPYGARSFNWEDPRPYIDTAHSSPAFPTRAQGVVEQCTFCEERLDYGRLPACVEACPARALTFGNLADPRSEIRELLRSRRYLRRKPELGTGPNLFYLL